MYPTIYHVVQAIGANMLCISKGASLIRQADDLFEIEQLAETALS